MNLCRNFGWGVVCLSLSGCSDPAQPQGCDVCFTTAVANVFVRDSTLQRVASVPVEVRSYLQICGLDLRGGEGPLVTDSSGHRRMTISSLYSPHTAQCFVVRVNPDSIPSFPIGSQEFTVSVQFRLEDGTPRDSVRFDVIVPVR